MVTFGEDRVSCPVGFRSVEVAGRQLLVNGRAVRICGVNRHDHDDRRGRAVTRELMEADARLMKQFNVNAVRCSHYPNDPYWLELCDRLGLYVIDEANIEAHAYYDDLCADPRYARRVPRARAEHGRARQEPPERDPVVARQRERLRAQPRRGGRLAARLRPVRGRSTTRARSRATGRGGRTARPTSCARCTPTSTRSQVWAAADPGDDPRPLILCEFSHAMGNSNGGLSDYYAAFDRHDALQGGFVWEWIDHGIRRTDDHGRDYWAYGGDFGEARHDSNFCADGLVWPDRTPHPAMHELKYLAAPVRVEALDARAGRFRIHNRNDFVDLSYVRGEWEGGDLPPLDAAPGESQDVALDVAGHEHVTFRFFAREATEWAPAGHEVAWGQCEVERAPRRGPDRSGGSRVTSRRRCRSSSTARASRCGARRPTTTGCRWCPDKSPGPLARWLELGLDRLDPEGLATTSSTTAPTAYSKTARCWWSTRSRSATSSATSRASASCSCCSRGSSGSNGSAAGRGELPRPPGLRDRSATTAARSRTSTCPYIAPQEHGHHGDVRWLTLTDESGAGVKITGVPAIGFTASHFSAADLTAARHTIDLEPRAEVILHLDAAQRGLGTASCGPDTSPQYRLDAPVYRFAYTLRALPG